MKPLAEVAAPIFERLADLVRGVDAAIGELHQITDRNKRIAAAMTNTIASRIRDIVANHLNEDRARLTDETHLIHDLGADSLDHIELIMAFEDHFSIDISDADAEGIRTIGQIETMITRKLAAKPAKGAA